MEFVKIKNQNTNSEKNNNREKKFIFIIFASNYNILNLNSYLISIFKIYKIKFFLLFISNSF